MEQHGLYFFKKNKYCTINTTVSYVDNTIKLFKLAYLYGKKTHKMSFVNVACLNLQGLT